MPAAREWNKESTGCSNSASRMDAGYIGPWLGPHLTSQPAFERLLRHSQGGQPRIAVLTGNHPCGPVELHEESLVVPVLGPHKLTERSLCHGLSSASSMQSEASRRRDLYGTAGGGGCPRDGTEMPPRWDLCDQAT